MTISVLKLVTVIAVLLWAPHSHAREPVATSDRFAFYSDFETNLNDALVAAGVAHKRGRDELFLAGDERACFEALAPSLQAKYEPKIAMRLAKLYQQTWPKQRVDVDVVATVSWAGANYGRSSWGDYREAMDAAWPS